MKFEIKGGSIKTTEENQGVDTSKSPFDVAPITAASVPAATPVPPIAAPVQNVETERLAQEHMALINQQKQHINEEKKT